MGFTDCTKELCIVLVLNVTKMGLLLAVKMFNPRANMLVYRMLTWS